MNAYGPVHVDIADYPFIVEVISPFENNGKVEEARVGTGTLIHPEVVIAFLR